MRKHDCPVDDIRQYLEPGPVVLVSSAWKGRTNIMTMGWHMVMGEAPSLVGCFIWEQNHSFEMIRKSRECVINVPAVDLATTVVGIGNTSGRDIDKFARFDLAAVKGRKVNAPLIEECHANFECRLVDTTLVARYSLVRVRGRERSRAGQAEVSQDAALPRRRTVHDRGSHRPALPQGLHAGDAPGLALVRPQPLGRPAT
jgi:flavin reductase (DIM6/NTAB) family NADH-FMN oxidoreductase RutF